MLSSLDDCSCHVLVDSPLIVFLLVQSAVFAMQLIGQCLWLSCSLTLQEKDRTSLTYCQKTLTVRIPTKAALPALASYCDDLNSLQSQKLGKSLLLPVWVRLQLNDGQECGPFRSSIAVQGQMRSNSGYKFLMYGLNEVFNREHSLKVIRATCWQLQLPSLFCRIRCPNDVAEEVLRAVQGLQQDTAGFNMLQPPFHDFQVFLHFFSL